MSGRLEGTDFTVVIRRDVCELKNGLSEWMYQAPVYPSDIRVRLPINLQEVHDLKKLTLECYGSTEERDTIRQLVEVSSMLTKQAAFVLRTLVSS